MGKHLMSIKLTLLLFLGLPTGAAIHSSAPERKRSRGLAGAIIVANRATKVMIRGQ